MIVYRAASALTIIRTNTLVDYTFENCEQIYYILYKVEK